MCHLNLDMRRPNIEKRAGKKFHIPVIYITQAVGLAMGIEPKKLGLQRHKVKVRFGEGKAHGSSFAATITPVSAKPTTGANSAAKDGPTDVGPASGDSPADFPSSGTSAGSEA
jgi:hypothetical protein